MVGTVLVTGARGFVGRALLPALLQQGLSVVALTREAPQQLSAAPSDERLRWRQTAPDFADLDTAWPGAVDTVIHLAARVHQMGETQSDALPRYLASNCDATLRLALLARERGVSRFIFVSSIKALGETEPGRPFLENDQAHPTDPYGVSKHQAELGLRELETDLFQVVIVRFPLVYGPGVRANFLQLARAVERGLPLPLKRAVAPRSLLGLDNAVAGLMCCLEHASARGKTFHLADIETPSVKELVESLARAYRKRARLFDVPIPVLRVVGRWTGRSETIDRLIEPLRLDTSFIRSEIGFTAPVPLETGLLRFVGGIPHP